MDTNSSPCLLHTLVGLSLLNKVLKVIPSESNLSFLCITILSSSLFKLATIVPIGFGSTVELIKKIEELSMSPYNFIFDIIYLLFVNIPS